MSQEIIDESELAKQYIASSALDDTCKKSLLRLINLSAMATNGISVEEKIQKITEAIQSLAVTQVMFLNSVDNKIANAITSANKDQCEQCKAMTHALEVEEEEKNKALIEKWKKENGIVDKGEEDTDTSWIGIIKVMLTKPYIYIVTGLLAISPYGVEIVKVLLDFFGTK